MDDSQYEPKLMAWFTKKVGHTCTPSFPLRPTQLIPFFFWLAYVSPKYHDLRILQQSLSLSLSKYISCTLWWTVRHASLGVVLNAWCRPRSLAYRRSGGSYLTMRQAFVPTIVQRVRLKRTWKVRVLHVCTAPIDHTLRTTIFAQRRLSHRYVCVHGFLFPST